MSHRFLVLGLLASALLGSGAVRAADLDSAYADIPQPEAQTPVEFGSGWYIRGDAGATYLPSIKINSPRYPTEREPSIPGAPKPTLGGPSQLGYVASLAGGYQLNRWFRGDVGFDVRQPLAANATTGNGRVFCPTGVTYPNKVNNPNGSTTWGAPDYASGGCTGFYRSTVTSFDVLVNAYVDLGTWYRVTPYVGAGVGLSFGHYQSSATYIQANGQPYHVSYTDPKFNATYYNNYDRTSSGGYYNFAWALMAGVAIDVFDHTKLDLGYRYLNVGSIPGVSGKLAYNEARVGLRYMIDEGP